MCIIVVKEKGLAVPSENILATCFENNGDGAGLMYTENGAVKIEKGFMDLDSLLNKLAKLEERFGSLKEKALVLHFRIKSYGNVNPGNTHPYPLSANPEDYKQLKFSCELAVAHNGTLSAYKPQGADEAADLNDTQVFIRDYLYQLFLTKAGFLEDETVKAAILQQLDEGKLAFLDKNDRLVTIGDFEEAAGIKYSNVSYLEKKTDN